VKRPQHGRLHLAKQDRITCLLLASDTRDHIAHSYDDSSDAFSLLSSPDGTRVLAYMRVTAGRWDPIEEFSVRDIIAALTTDEYHWVYCCHARDRPSGSPYYLEYGTRAVVLTDGSLVQAADDECFWTLSEERVVQHLRGVRTKTPAVLHQWPWCEFLWSLGEGSLEDYLRAQPGFPSFTPKTCPVCKRVRTLTS